jgi:hypothetical protein
LLKAGLPVPKPVVVDALVDTGASHTCVDPWVLRKLSLSPTGTTQVSTPSTGETPAEHELYDMSLTIYAADEQPPLVHETIAVIGCRLTPQGMDVLIGRDVLEGCLLVFDGVSGTFSLAY